MHCDLRAYFVQSQFQPEFELQDAQRFTEQLGIPLTVLPCDILQHPLVVENGPLRCYHCKTALFTALWERARMDGYPLLLDGTNASDRTDDRPGMRALEELEVRSPLRECGLTKADIRSLSREAGLFTWDKPAYACLATRIPTGTSITAEQLEHVERSEQILSSLGFSDLRVRTENGSACLELPHPQFIRFAPLFPLILKGFCSIWLPEIRNCLIGEKKRLFRLSRQLLRATSWKDSANI